MNIYDYEYLIIVINVFYHLISIIIDSVIS